MDENLIKEIEFYKEKLAKSINKLYEYETREERKSIKVIDQCIENKFSIYHGDCVEVLKGIPSDSIHYSIFSPPFSSLFTYSASIRDMGNSIGDSQFITHFKFAVKELFRIIKPGRLLTFHCSDIPAMKERDGYMGLKDFPGILLTIFEEVGFIYSSKHIIWKDPLVEVTRTKALGLMHKQIIKDSCRCRAGCPDYLVTVLKPGENQEPVSRKRGFEEYIGDKEEPKQPKNDDPAINKYSHFVWQRYASPVWMDINQTDTLNVKMAREKEDERHICPLQLHVITRCLELWTNPNDIVLSPFAGIGSEGYQALKQGRRFVGIELKKSYYEVMKKNLLQVKKQNTLGLK